MEETKAKTCWLRGSECNEDCMAYIGGKCEALATGEALVDSIENLADVLSTVSEKIHKY